jgi:hypothetical protein
MCGAVGWSISCWARSERGRYREGIEANNAPYIPNQNVEFPLPTFQDLLNMG